MNDYDDEGSSGKPDDPAPVLDGTLDSCDRLASWVARHVADDTLPARRADAISMAIAKQQASIRERQRQNEEATLRALATSMEDAVSRRVQREKAERYEGAAVTGPGTQKFGRVKASDDSH